MDKFPVNKIVPTVALKARLYLIKWTWPRSRKLKMLSILDSSPLLGLRKTTKLRPMTSRELQRNQNTWNAVSLSVFPKLEEKRTFLQFLGLTCAEYGPKGKDQKVDEALLPPRCFQVFDCP